MPWNEPGKDDKDQKQNDSTDKPKEPWKNQSKQEGPPDLDEALRKLRGKLSKVFGGKGGGGASSGDKFGLLGLGLFLFIVIIIWAVSGFYIVKPANEAVVLRFGKYIKTEQPGLHWIPRFISEKYIVNVAKINTLNYSVDTLTRDNNMININLTVLYKISNPENYLFNVTDSDTSATDSSLYQATAGAVRDVIGQIPLANLLPVAKIQNPTDPVVQIDEKPIDSAKTPGTHNSEEDVIAIPNDVNINNLVRTDISKETINTMKLYKAGITITKVTLQSLKPPKGKVNDAYDNANQSREEEKLIINKAKNYRANIIPSAFGVAAQIVNLANANQQKIILNAEGDIAPFMALLPQYESAREVTRERLYIQTIQSVLSKSSKILVDTKGGNLLYLPLNKLITEAQNTSSMTDDDDAVNSAKTELVNQASDENDTNDISSPNNISQLNNSTTRSTFRNIKRETTR